VETDPVNLMVWGRGRVEQGRVSLGKVIMHGPLMRTCNDISSSLKWEVGGRRHGASRSPTWLVVQSLASVGMRSSNMRSSKRQVRRQKYPVRATGSTAQDGRSTARARMTSARARCGRTPQLVCGSSGEVTETRSQIPVGDDSGSGDGPLDFRDEQVQRRVP
jgi:hypothetical protein